MVGIAWIRGSARVTEFNGAALAPDDSPARTPTPAPAATRAEAVLIRLMRLRIGDLLPMSGRKAAAFRPSWLPVVSHSRTFRRPHTLRRSHAREARSSESVAPPGIEPGTQGLGNLCS